MLEQLRTIVTAVNTWLVVAGAALAVLVDEITPLAGLHPALEWAVRVAGLGIVAVGVASRILARSTEVPAPLRGLRPAGDVNQRWPAWNGGQFRYIAPLVGRSGRRPAGPSGDASPPDTAA